MGVVVRETSNQAGQGQKLSDGTLRHPSKDSDDDVIITRQREEASRHHDL